MREIKFAPGIVRVAVMAAACCTISSLTSRPAVALSPISLSSAALAGKPVSDAMTIPVQHRHGGGHFHGGGGFRGGHMGGGGFRGGHIGGGFRGGHVGGFHRGHGGGFHGGHIGRGFHGGGFHRAPAFYGGYRQFHRPHFHRRHFHRRFYYAPSYYYPRYYHPRRFCRVVWTQWGPRKICRHRPWGYPRYYRY